MGKSKSDSGVFVATETFSTVASDGEHYQVHQGKTRVREGHPLLDACPEYFKPVEENVTYDLEQATKAPGEKRGKPAAAPPADPEAPADPIDLPAKSRGDLNEIAEGLGIENPEKLQNKLAVIEAIEAAQKAE